MDKNSPRIVISLIHACALPPNVMHIWIVYGNKFITNRSIIELNKCPDMMLKFLLTKFVDKYKTSSIPVRYSKIAFSDNVLYIHLEDSGTSN